MRKLFAILGVLALAGSLAVAAGVSGAADHLDAPGVTRDGRTDINDVYVFQSPTDPDNTVLVMTVNPGAGVISGTSFRPGASYEFGIDNNGNVTDDVVIRSRFGGVRASDGTQQMVVSLNGRPVGIGRTGTVGEIDGGGSFIAGVYDDPFFFDLAAFQQQVQGADGGRTFCDGGETDFFAGLNVSAIVIEIPSELLGADTTVGVRAQTRNGSNIVDQMGRPAINTVLIPSLDKDGFNETPIEVQEALYRYDVTDTLLALSGLDGTPYSVAEAQAITDVLLPDVNTYDPTSSAGFLNGRQLADDVIDAELGLVTGGFFGGSAVLTSDCVGGNDVAFSATFPYLAPAHP